MKKGQSAQGFTLVESLVVIALVGILALAMIPVFSSQHPARLDAAAAEVGNVLRFAVSESKRSGGYVFVDGSVPGRLALLNSNAAGADLGALADLLTKRAMTVDASGAAAFGQVDMAPRFFKGGTPYTQLLIGPGPQLQAFEGGINRGALEAGSGVVLTLGLQTTTVSLNEATGKVTIP